MGENFGPSYFAIITGPLLDNRALAANAKLLYASITSLTDSRGYCWASNKYLADRFGWGERTVTRLVAQLQEQGFIRTAMALNRETGQMERRIYIGNEAAEGVAKIGDPSQNWRGGVAKTGEAIIRMNSKEEYIVEYKQNAQETYNTKVWIDKETGLPNDKIRTSNNIDIFERREYEIGKVKDEDVKKIDIYEYTMK